MTKAKHTPLPWLRDRSSGLECDVRAASKRKVALCFGLSQTPHKTREAMNAYKAECDANAEFIVRACNAHDELVRVATLVLTGLESGVVKSPPLLDMGNPNAESVPLQSLADIVRAALSKATKAQS